MSSYWMVVIIESSEAGNREVFHMVAQSDGPKEPSAIALFEAGKHFGVKPREDSTHSSKVGTFQPDKKMLAKIASLSSFPCEKSRFWEFRSVT